MTGLDTVVVGVDGSKASAVSLTWAADRLSSGGSLHVVHGFSPLLELGYAVLQRNWEPLRDEARESLGDDWLAPARGCDGTIETHFVEDDPADAMLRVATSHAADAIVVGPHGTTGNRQVLGSVTRKLLHQSSMPVVVGKARRVGLREPSGDQAIEPILSCIGYGDASEQAARWAAAYAEADDRPLSLLHVLSRRPMFPTDSPADTLAGYLGSEVSLDWAQADLDRLKGEAIASHPSLTVTTNVEVGFAAKTIAANSVGTELVVLGKRRGNLLTRRTISPRIQQVIVSAASATAVIPSCSTSQ